MIRHFFLSVELLFVGPGAQAAKLINAGHNGFGASLDDGDVAAEQLHHPQRVFGGVGQGAVAVYRADAKHLKIFR